MAWCRVLPSRCLPGAKFLHQTYDQNVTASVSVVLVFLAPFACVVGSQCKIDDFTETAVSSGFSHLFYFFIFFFH